MVLWSCNHDTGCKEWVCMLLIFPSPYNCTPLFLMTTIFCNAFLQHTMQRPFIKWTHLPPVRKEKMPRFCFVLGSCCSCCCCGGSFAGLVRSMPSCSSRGGLEGNGCHASSASLLKSGCCGFCFGCCCIYVWGEKGEEMLPFSGAVPFWLAAAWV